MNDALVRAAFLGNMSQVSTLLSIGCHADHILYMHPDNIIRAPMTPLAAAAYHGHAQICKRLLELGATVERHTLHGLMFCRYPEVAELLLAALPPGTNLNDTGFKLDSKQSLLSLAASVNNVEMCRLLIRHGMKADGEYLHVPAAKGLVNACRVLLENGARVGLPQNDEGTALHVAARHGQSRVCQLLLEHGASPDSVFECWLHSFV